jgi:triosephosphate isomerase
VNHAFFGLAVAGDELPRLARTTRATEPDIHMRQLAVGTNIKMYLGYGETVAWMQRLRAALGSAQGVELFAFVPAVCLVDARRLLSGTPIGYGAQNVHWAESGPYTGELSTGMLRELGCTHVELGHTERRRLFGETDAEVHRKLERSLGAGLRAVVCLGEVERGPEAAVRRHLAAQVQAILGGLDPASARSFLLAYEPGWAIGVAEAAPAAYVQEMHAHLREAVAGVLGPPAAARLKIVYGGSVTPSAVPDFCRAPDVDGLFVGRSALDVERFERIITDAIRCRTGQAAAEPRRGDRAT